MSNTDHLPASALIRAIDDELSDSEAASIGSHLSQCEECSRQYQELALLSSRLETLIARTPVPASTDSREAVAGRLERGVHRTQGRRPQKVLRHFGIGIAIAAMLAIAVMLAPHRNHSSQPHRSAPSRSENARTFELAGETFVGLPYANSDLPIDAPQILQMRVPVSSLVAAGFTVEPISMQAANSDSSVLADVLLGTDGQPVAVHLPDFD